MKLRLTLLSFALFSISPMVLAQSFSGSVNDLNTIFDPPSNIQGTLCDPTLNSGKDFAYKACADGVAAARWMAEKYAANSGRYLGCLDGFYQGIWDGYSGARNPTREMVSQAEAYVKEANFSSAASRGLERARAEGQTASAHQIISRYRSVIGLRNANGTPVMPDKSYAYPKITFQGFEDGYEYDVINRNQAEYDQVVRLGWINSNSSMEDKIAARRAYGLQREYANSMCNNQETIFGRRNMPAVTLWDYFSAKRRSDFQNYGWKNADWAWEIFDRDEKTLEQYQTFMAIRKLEKTVTESIPIKERRYKLDASGNPVKILDANGQPVLDSQGRPSFEMEEVVVGHRQETRREKLSAEEVRQLETLYINNFKVAYERYYARQYASRGYNSEGIEKYKVARIIGKSIGEDVASHLARQDAYNNKYQLQSAQKYAEEVKRLYKTSFDRLIGIFENNPVLEIDEAQIIGEVQDSIFRPGEQIKVQFGVTNLGEAARPSSLALDNSIDVIANPNGFNFTVPVLSSQKFVTPVMGQITEDKLAGERINISMGIKNPGNLDEVARSLVVRKAQQFELHDYAEIETIKESLDPIKGHLNLLVVLKNHATGNFGMASQIVLDMGFAGQDEKNVMMIDAGSTTTVALNAIAVDPLKLIEGESVSGNVAVKIGNRTADRRHISYRSKFDRPTGLLEYFDALATGKSTNIGSDSKDERLTKLENMFEEYVKLSISKNVYWKDKVQVEATMIGLLVKKYEDSKRGKLIDAEAQLIYDSLVKVLARNTKDIQGGKGVFNFRDKPNQEAFLKELAKISKISTNPKSH